MQRTVFIIFCAFLLACCASQYSVGRLLVDNDKDVQLGVRHEFKAYMSSSTELRFYSSKEDVGTLDNCISAIYGADVDSKRYRSLDGRLIEFSAVVAEYRDGFVIGANKALGDRELASFENQCGRAHVLVLVP